MWGRFINATTETTEYYQEKYGALDVKRNKLYLLMEKQHNRGQEAPGCSLYVNWANR